MARYSVLTLLLTVPRHAPIAQAETPAEIVRLAKQFAQQGKMGLRIGDNELEDHFSVEEFAAKHGIR